MAVRGERSGSEGPVERVIEHAVGGGRRECLELIGRATIIVEFGAVGSTS